MKELTNYKINNENVSYEILENGYNIYLGESVWISQLDELSTPIDKNMTIEENCLAQLKEICEPKDEEEITDPNNTDNNVDINDPNLSLDKVKKLKTESCSELCKKYIEDGVDIDIDGNTEHFSYGIESGDQGNIDDIMNLVQKTGLAQPYHSDNGLCKLYSAEQIISIYMSQKINKSMHTTYFNQLKGYINTLESADDVRAVEYGQPLTGLYLNNYITIMNQSNQIINSLLSSMGELADVEKIKITINSIFDVEEAVAIQASLNEDETTETTEE